MIGAGALGGARRGALHRAHPASKLAWMISFSALPLAVSTVLGQGAILGVLILTAVLGGVGLRPLLEVRHLAIPIGLIVGLNFVITRNLEFSAAMGLRMASMAAAAFLFFSVTDPMEIADLLSMAGAPPPVALAGMVAFRFVPVMIEDLRGIAAAQRSRGYRSDVGGPVERVRRLAPILIPALVLVVRRSQAVAESVESRGFGGRAKRTLYPEYRLGRVDAALLLWAAAPWAALMLL